MNLDRISCLPQDTIEKILTLMPIRDALRTSILSRKWRYSWRSMPKIVFDTGSAPILEQSDDEILYKYRFLKVVFHVLLLRSAPILELGLILEPCFFEEINSILLHLSLSNNIKKFTYNNLGSESYFLPCSLFSIQGLEHLHLRYCEFVFPLMNKGFSKLKCLHFSEVTNPNDMIFEFLANCPLLEEFTWYIGYDEIYLTDSEFVELFKCIPSIQVLETSKLNITYLGAGGMPHKLPISLPNLRILVLEVCILELSTVLCVVNSSPNLEKIKLRCWDHKGDCLHHTCEKLLDPNDYLGLNLDHLKQLEITSCENNNHAFEMEFVKLIMANSPLLNKALIKPSLWASPAECIIIERPKH